MACFRGSWLASLLSVYNVVFHSQVANAMLQMPFSKLPVDANPHFASESLRETERMHSKGVAALYDVLCVPVCDVRARTALCVCKDQTIGFFYSRTIRESDTVQHLQSGYLYRFLTSFPQRANNDLQYVLYALLSFCNSVAVHCTLNDYCKHY